MISFQKPIIMSIPQTEKSWNLGDILKSTKNLQTKMAKDTISKSTLDLSSPGTETLKSSQSQANVRQTRISFLSPELYHMGGIISTLLEKKSFNGSLNT